MSRQRKIFAKASKPQSKASEPQEELPNAEEEAPVEAPKHQYVIRHNPKGISPFKKGSRIGRMEVQSGSIPKPPPVPLELKNPKVEVLVCEASRDGKAYRYRIISLHDSEVLQDAGDTVFDTGLLSRTSRGWGFSRVLRKFLRHKKRQNGVPGLL